jgi:polyisoprenoid-binding protein YceI
MSTVLQPQVATATTWTIDPSHTQVEFSVKHMMISTVRGRFGGVRGTIVADEAGLAPLSIDVEIDAASIDTRDARRDEHLRSADFFDAENYPSLTFASRRVEPAGEGRWRVIGDLTIRGVRREVVLSTEFNGRGTNPWGQDVAGATAETSINRREYGLNWNVALEAGGVLVGESVRIALEVQASRQPSGS